MPTATLDSLRAVSRCRCGVVVAPPEQAESRARALVSVAIAAPQLAGRAGGLCSPLPTRTVRLVARFPLRCGADSGVINDAIAGVIVIGILLVWTLVLTWYLIFGLWLVPYRLIRRSSRKNKREALRHQELLAVVSGQGHVNVQVNQPTAPVVSPDGNYFWSGTAWSPVQQ
jgi:hypothetical protein